VAATDGDAHAVFADDMLVKTRVLRPVHAGNAAHDLTTLALTTPHR
jgi:hypothetical protein